MPNKAAKRRKWDRQKRNKWLAENGRTANQYRKKQEKRNENINEW
jgi:hypothetical protein